MHPGRGLTAPLLRPLCTRSGGLHPWRGLSTPIVPIPPPRRVHTPEPGADLPRNPADPPPPRVQTPEPGADLPRETAGAGRLGRDEGARRPPECSRRQRSLTHPECDSPVVPRATVLPRTKPSPITSERSLNGLRDSATTGSGLAGEYFRAGGQTAAAVVQSPCCRQRLNTGPRSVGRILISLSRTVSIRTWVERSARTCGQWDWYPPQPQSRTHAAMGRSRSHVPLMQPCAAHGAMGEPGTFAWCH